jgi:hypothetical protein
MRAGLALAIAALALSALPPAPSPAAPLEPLSFTSRSRLTIDSPPIVPGWAGTEAEAAPELAPLALAVPYLQTPRLDVSISSSKPPKKNAKPSTKHSSTAGLTSERAQALLRSATYPGWGQATLGHPTAGAVFASIELGIMASFVAFNIQENMRHDSAVRTAAIYAGVDLKGTDDEFQRIVGAYSSSDEYNQLVVFRDAANLYYNDPVLYRQYIAEHSLSGAMSWSWQDVDSFNRYASQRQDVHRAEMRANTSLALAVANRLASVLHVVLLSGKSQKAASLGGWNLELAPAGGDDPSAIRCGVRTRF